MSNPSDLHHHHLHNVVGEEEVVEEGGAYHENSQELEELQEEEYIGDEVIEEVEITMEETEEVDMEQVHQEEEDEQHEEEQVQEMVSQKKIFLFPFFSKKKLKINNFSVKIQTIGKFKKLRKKIFFQFFLQIFFENKIKFIEICILQLKKIFQNADGEEDESAEPTVTRAGRIVKKKPLFDS